MFCQTLSIKDPFGVCGFTSSPALGRGADSGGGSGQLRLLCLSGLECFEGMVLQWFVWVGVGSE